MAAGVPSFLKGYSLLIPSDVILSEVILSERTNEMQYGKIWGLGLLVAISLAAIGCGQSRVAPPENREHAHEHDHGATADHVHGEGPHGGVIFDFGRHHAEFTVDHDKQQCMVYILGDDAKTPTPIAASELTLTTKPTQTDDGQSVAPMTIKLLPADEADGKASAFAGVDPGLGNVADFSGTIFAEVDGKPLQGEFAEEARDR